MFQLNLYTSTIKLINNIAAELFQGHIILTNATLRSLPDSIDRFSPSRWIIFSIFD